MKTPISAVIFDHDGTLVETESAHYHIWRELLLELGIELKEEEYFCDCNGLPSLDNAQLFVKRHPISQTAESLLAEKERRAHDFFAANLPPLMPAVEDCLNACLDANLRLAIATGASMNNLTHAIEQRSLYKNFHTIATADQVHANKPAPDVYHLAMHKMGLQASQCVAVEDSPTGIAAAKAAGLYCIAIPSQYSRHQNLSQADICLPDLHQAAEKIITMSCGSVSH